ncbi:MAG: hypothetical protein ACR2PH_12250 [Desulfobulbia bacterium]
MEGHCSLEGRVLKHLLQATTPDAPYDIYEAWPQGTNKAGDTAPRVDSATGLVLERMGKD